MKRSDINNFFKKIIVWISAFFSWVWYTTWKDDSFKGWLFAIIFLFILIKFIFFPVLNLATGTSLPLAIVESCSMYHEGNLLSNSDEWWEENKDKYSSFQITDEDFTEFSMKKGFNKGDILFIVGANPEELQVGDVIIFNTNYRYPIIHRIIGITETESGKRIFSTMGDNNSGQADFEKSISEEQLVGKAVFRLAPYFGWVKLILFEWQKPQSEKGLCD